MAAAEAKVEGGVLIAEWQILAVLRDRQGATLITSQFPVSQWHELINDATVADAILDRLVHNAYRLELKGESLRKGKGSNSHPSVCD